MSRRGEGKQSKLTDAEIEIISVLLTQPKQSEGLLPHWLLLFRSEREVRPNASQSTPCIRLLSRSYATNITGGLPWTSFMLASLNEINDMTLAMRAVKLVKCKESFNMQNFYFELRY